MSYLYEQLGEWGFQKLCQSILAAEHPDLQCLPVRQPDGGRDAFIRSHGSTAGKPYSVFQVKYSDAPDSKHERDVIADVIKSESEKICRLKEDGVRTYYLITNVRGTSHRDTGSIDRVNKALSEAFDIEAYCWWRDDIDRRLDRHSDIKWSFPDILKATDLLKVFYETRLGNDYASKLRPIKSYMSLQAQSDAKLKFKQIDLARGIVDLFVDVPVAIKGALPSAAIDVWERITSASGISVVGRLSDNGAHIELRHGGDSAPPGTLHVLNLISASEEYPLIVLEGAPGQGKSTISQFLCQLHRMRLLDRPYELKRVDSGLIPPDVRVPFKVDLRDYATWLNGKDPFSESGEEPIPRDAQPVLESFLAFQVSRFTGLSFSADSLLDVAAASKLLLVLDGFDEVADVNLRSRIIREINHAATRLREVTLSTQIVITSRPTAFANSPGFSRSEWLHLNMRSLSRSVIDQYTEKWLQGRGADARERRGVNAVLDTKLRQPHIRDLARNPMQLTILLALISVQGASLPDKRTTLYDRYIEIFLNRESEKSTIVRDHRETLIQIHRYLAWRLQAEAEDSGSSGNIAETRLRTIVREFLRQAGHKEDLVELLFSGVVERVVALVQRVQGTYEFEVQPLREYFAARYLYDTAPYCAAGSRAPGTLPERFEAIARNFYWLNVTRFYAGCYNSGELASLIDNLDSLSEVDHFRAIAHVSRLRLFLISDHVFSQYPVLSKRALNGLLMQERIRILFADTDYYNADEALALPEGLARDTLKDFAMSQMRFEHHWDSLYYYGKLLRANGDHAEIYSFWMDVFCADGLSTENAIDAGRSLGIFAFSSKEECSGICDRFGREGAIALFDADRFWLFDESPSLYGTIFETTLDIGRSFYPIIADGSPPSEGLYWVTIFNSLFTRLDLFRERGAKDRTRLGDALHDSSTISRSVRSADTPLKGTPELPEPIRALLQRLLDTPVHEAFADLETFGTFYELCLAHWGERPAMWMLPVAVMEVAAEEGVPRGIDVSPPFKRAYEMFSHRGSTEFWEQLLCEGAGASENERALELAGLWLWAPLIIICELASQVRVALDSLSDSSLELLASRILRRGIKGGEDVLPSGWQLPEFQEQSDAFWGLFAGRLGRGASKWMSLFPESAIVKAGPRLLSSLIYNIDTKDFEDEEGWSYYLTVARRSHAIGLAFPLSTPHDPSAGRDMPVEVARRVCFAPEEYPIAVLGMATRTFTSEVGGNSIPVGRIAANDGWFSESADTAFPSLYR